MVREGRALARPAAEQQFGDPLHQVDGLRWLGADIRGWRVLALAAGGGRQSALYATAGGAVTVVDISPEMLALDRAVASERALAIRTVEGSMDDLSMLPAAEFDLVIHPVSTCYLPNVGRVFAEIARVTKPGGLYVSQHKSPTSLQAGTKPGAGGNYELTEPYYRIGPLPEADRGRLREAGTLEFLHRWEDLIGGMCRAGFVIEDLVEPLHAERDADPGTFAHRATYIAPYVRIKARRQGPTTGRKQEKLWTPSSSG